MHHAMIETLRDAQRFGFFGARPIEDAIEHSMAYVRAVAPLPSGARVVDLGSGGGLPGLLLADAFDDVSVLLIDRRRKRTDFLERAVGRMHLTEVEIRTGDVADLVADVGGSTVDRFDVVTARGFGPPDLTLRFSEALVAQAGVIVISEPPVADRWPSELLDELALRRERLDAVSVFRRASSPRQDATESST